MGEKKKEKINWLSFTSFTTKRKPPKLQPSLLYPPPRAPHFLTMAFALKARVCMGANTRAGRRSVSLHSRFAEGFAGETSGVEGKRNIAVFCRLPLEKREKTIRLRDVAGGTACPCFAIPFCGGARRRRDAARYGKRKRTRAEARACERLQRFFSRKKKNRVRFSSTGCSRRRASRR